MPSHAPPRPCTPRFPAPHHTSTRCTLCRFKAKKEHQELLERSLTEISTSTVISGEIIFLSGNHGQITPLAADQQNVVLISTAGIDFDEPARNPAAGREEAQYFKITKQLPNGDVEGDWINEAAHAAFKERIKLVWSVGSMLEGGGVGGRRVPLNDSGVIPDHQPTSGPSVSGKGDLKAVCSRGYY